MAESALTTCCSLDAQRFQLRGLILHDLRRYTEAAKVCTSSVRLTLDAHDDIGDGELFGLGLIVLWLEDRGSVGHARVLRIVDLRERRLQNTPSKANTKHFTPLIPR